MPRVRRKSVNDLYQQGSRIRRLALGGRNPMSIPMEQYMELTSTPRYLRAANTMSRYVANIRRAVGNDNNRRVSRNTYMGTSRGSING